MNNYQDTTHAVVAGLSEVIRSELTALSSEYWAPRFAADQMDAELAFRRRRIAFLRKAREEFEDQMHGLGMEE